APMHITKVRASSNRGAVLACFWLIVFLVNLGPTWNRYSSVREGIEVAGLSTVLQGLVSFVAVRYLDEPGLNFDAPLAEDVVVDMLPRSCREKHM
ncbi:MAG: hypothetical protein AAFY15_06915, partial [Cyanobacteria bacterium J06648_11]